MVGRLRQGTGTSDKLQGCCVKCCETVCRLSPWNRLICYGCVILSIGIFVLILGGAILVSGVPTGMRDFKAAFICGNSTRGQKDITVPSIRANAYVWWMLNAGIFCAIMVAFTFVCCCSFVILCCNFSLPKGVQICGIVGLVLLILAFLLYLIWLGFGTYLISTFGPQSGSQALCPRIVVYVIIMFIFLFIFIGVSIAACVWAIHKATAGDESKSTQSRASVKSQPKMPSTKLIKAMV